MSSLRQWRLAAAIALGAFGVSTLLWVAPVAAEAPPTFLLQWGSFGSGPGQFSSPSGIAVDVQGSVYVTDPGNYRVQKFTANGGFLLQWGTQGTGEGQFRSPSGITVAPDGTIYVSDRLNLSIDRFNADGTFIGRWVTGAHSPKYIAIDPTGTYLYFTAGRFVDKFTVDGVFVTAWDAGDTPSLSDNVGIAVAADGKVYVAADVDSKIKIFDADGTQVGVIPLQIVWGLAFDGAGALYATTGLGVLYKFDAIGQVLWQFGGSGSGSGQYLAPRDLCISNGDQIYIVDLGHNVEKLGQVPTPTYEMSWGRLKMRYR